MGTGLRVPWDIWLIPCMGYSSLSSGLPTPLVLVPGPWTLPQQCGPTRLLDPGGLTGSAAPRACRTDLQPRRPFIAPGGLSSFLPPSPQAGPCLGSRSLHLSHAGNWALLGLDRQDESLPSAHSSPVIPAVLGLHFWFSGNKEIMAFFHYHYHERVPTHCRASSPGVPGPLRQRSEEL